MQESIISTTSDTFRVDLLGADLPVVVEFTATWCAPCRRLQPVLQELAARYQGRVRVLAADVEADAELAQAYRVSSMPTLLGFHRGEVVVQEVGFSRRARVERLFEELLRAATSLRGPWDGSP